MYESVLTFLSLPLVGLIVAGLLKRGRYRVCRMFLLFVVVVYVTDVLPTLWRDRFYTSLFWLIREPLHNVLRFGVALELAYYTFRAFPGARSTARALLLFLVGSTLVAVLWATWELPRLPEYSEILSRLQPRLLNGTIWLLTGIAALILWYRLPVDPMHKAILLGWVPYLLIFTVILNLAAAYGWDEFLPKVSGIYTTAYFLLLAYWARAAWAPAGVFARGPATLTVPASQTS